MIVSVFTLVKANFHDLLTTPQEKLLKENQNQNVNELTLFD
mgnify:FL=1